MRAKALQNDVAAQPSFARAGLGLEKLRGIYDRIAVQYDFEHALITARADQRGRRILVESTVKDGDAVLDCGFGTGTTALLAARKVGPKGKVALFDLSHGRWQENQEGLPSGRRDNDRFGGRQLSPDLIGGGTDDGSRIARLEDRDASKRDRERLG